MLSGYKTKIGLIVIFILGGLRALNIVDNETFNILLPLAGAIAGYGIYDKIGRGEKKK